MYIQGCSNRIHVDCGFGVQYIENGILAFVWQWTTIPLITCRLRHSDYWILARTGLCTEVYWAFINCYDKFHSLCQLTHFVMNDIRNNSLRPNKSYCFSHCILRWPFTSSIADMKSWSACQAGGFTCNATYIHTRSYKLYVCVLWR